MIVFIHISYWLRSRFWLISILATVFLELQFGSLAAAYGYQMLFGTQNVLTSLFLFFDPLAKTSSLQIPLYPVVHQIFLAYLSVWLRQARKF